VVIFCEHVLCCGDRAQEIGTELNLKGIWPCADVVGAFFGMFQKINKPNRGAEDPNRQTY
jgi:hypothetical protein